MRKIAVVFLAFKISELLVLPTIITFILLVAGFFWKSRAVSGMGLLVFYLFSIRAVSVSLLRPLEGPYQGVNLERPCLSGNAVLLLGGFDEDLKRAVPAMTLYATCGKKFHLIISGIDPLVKGSTEAGDLKAALVSEGMPSGAITLEERSRTTEESARNLAAGLGKTPFYLLTSPYHMTRSLYAFREAGTHPVPFANPFQPPNRISGLDFIPSSAALAESDEALHEYAGLLFYKAHDFWKKRRKGTE